MQDLRTLCVAALGGNDAFWTYIDKIFERTTANGTGFALDKLGSLAAEVGVDQTQFQSCLDSNKYEKLVKNQIEDGTKAGVNGIPATLCHRFQRQKPDSCRSSTNRSIQDYY